MNGNLIIRGILLVTSFFIPPVLSMALWDKCLNITQPKDKSSIIEEYVLFFLIIHLVDVYVLAMRTGEIQRVMKDLVLDVNFSSGYLLQSLLVSVVVPCVGRVIERYKGGDGEDPQVVMVHILNSLFLCSLPFCFLSILPIFSITTSGVMKHIPLHLLRCQLRKCSKLRQEMFIHHSFI